MFVLKYLNVLCGDFVLMGPWWIQTFLIDIIIDIIYGLMEETNETGAKLKKKEKKRRDRVIWIAAYLALCNLGFMTPFGRWISWCTIKK